MNEFFSLFSSQVWWAKLLIIVGSILALYLARAGAHGAIKNLFGMLSSSLRLGARSLAIAERKLNQRNREVLLALGKEQAERELGREFFRINKFVERDLGGYPQLQRKIEEQVIKIDEDYKQAGEVPPPSPEWLQAVEAISKLQLKEQGNSFNKQILEAAEEHHHESLQAYRQSMEIRHKILKGTAPYWRKLSNSVDHVGKHLQELTKRSHSIDQKMERFEEICANTDKAERMIKASQVTQFMIALVVLAIATAGAFVNFQLIEYPMREMVDASNRILGVRVSEVAAFVLILLEITLGIFLMEALHVTRLFPMVGSMDDRMRVRGIWVVGTILLIFALMEASLALLRDVIQSQNYALRADLTGGTGDVSGITLVVNMGMGFFIPLILAIIAIPLEYLFHTGRTVIGMVVELLLRLLAIALRILSGVMKHAGRFFVSIYDVIILIQLWVWIESLFKKPGRTDEYKNNLRDHETQ